MAQPTSPPVDRSSPPAAGFRSTLRGLRARILERGSEDLENHELAALVLAAGTRGIERCRTLLAPERLVQLARRPASELAAALGPADGARLAAAFALGRRVERDAVGPRTSLRSPERVHRLLAPEVRGLARETFHVLLLDGKHRLVRRELVSVGTLTSSLVHPREFFRAAVRESAAAVIAAHNHPSGDPRPSPEDLEVTRRLLRAGRLLGIPLLDHVVLGDRDYVSLRDHVDFTSAGAGD